MARPHALGNLLKKWLHTRCWACFVIFFLLLTGVSLLYLGTTAGETALVITWYSGVLLVADTSHRKLNGNGKK